MRIVLDTNILVAAFLTQGTCAVLLEHCLRSHELVTSAEILAELRRVLVDKFRMAPRDATEAARLLGARMHVVVPEALREVVVTRDPDDDVILATARSGAAEGIVTGDRDLLDLRSYETISILAPSEFWRFERFGPPE